MGQWHDTVNEVFQGNKLLAMFDELTFKEKWTKMQYGLKQPKDSGDYKWARIYLSHLWSWGAAFGLPLFAILALCIFASNSSKQVAAYEVTVVEPEAIEKMEDIKPIEEELPIPEVTEFVESTADTPSIAPSEVSGPPAPNTDFSPKPTEMDTVAIVKSPVVLRGIIGSRNPGQRGSLLGGYGGGAATEGAVMRALRWLKINQQTDGSWGPANPAAMTALALLTYLAHGETPASDEFGPTVEKAIKWLCENQESNGMFKGRDGHNYTHPICTYALCEAYALTKVPAINYAAEKALEIILKGQHPSGGWDYNCAQTARDDTSYMGWCSQALKAAYMAQVGDSGEVKKAMKSSMMGYKKNADPAGGFGYVGPKGTHLTGAGTLCMMLMGGIKEPEVKRGLDWMDQKLTFNWETPGFGRPVYHWYYSTQAYFHVGGKQWTAWNKQFSIPLCRAQKVEKGMYKFKDKDFDIGHWVPMDKSEEGLGKVYNTTLCALMLQVYYRYLPTYKTPTEIEDTPAIGGQEQSKVKVEISI